VNYLRRRDQAKGPMDEGGSSTSRYFFEGCAAHHAGSFSNPPGLHLGPSKLKIRAGHWARQSWHRPKFDFDAVKRSLLLCRWGNAPNPGSSIKLPANGGETMGHQPFSNLDGSPSGNMPNWKGWVQETSSPDRPREVIPAHAQLRAAGSRAAAAAAPNRKRGSTMTEIQTRRTHHRSTG